MISAVCKASHFGEADKNTVHNKKAGVRSWVNTVINMVFTHKKTSKIVDIFNEDKGLRKKWRSSGTYINYPDHLS